MLIQIFITRLFGNCRCKHTMELSDELDNIIVMLDDLLANQIEESSLELLAEASVRLEELLKTAQKEEFLHG